VPVDAERWLAERGVQRETLQVEPLDVEPTAAFATSVMPDVAGTVLPGPEGDVPLATEAGEDDEDDPAGGVTGAIGSAAALAFIRRSTSNAPQSEGRLRAKLAERGCTEEVAEEALRLARSERLVDDPALLAALIAERRSRGHADIRLRRDLRDRGFTGEQVDAALARFAATDPAAMVFALARDQVTRHRAVAPEVAVRRTVGYLVRRGHGEALARKAARDAVYADREAQEAAGR
jgi:SOS response regulatory protein OraA/RecX